MQFRDLQKQYDVLKEEIDKSVRDVCSGAHYISGPEVKELEDKLAEYVGVKHCITCANGTDALTLALKTWGLGEGDAVFVPDFTFFSSGECPAAEDCTCIFVDIDKRTFNIDPEKLEEAIIKVNSQGDLKARAVVAVDLFGQPADYKRIRAICDKYDLLLLEDGAQGFGGQYNGKVACSFGDISTTSFFPAKPLGCYGDGGAVFTDNDDWADLIRSYAVHGKAGGDKYNNIRLGLNSRLDTIQAAILLVKFRAFVNYELRDINEIALMYNEEIKRRGLDSKVCVPRITDGCLSSWAQYTVILSEEINRELLQKKLNDAGIPTMVYYMKPMHLQGAFWGTASAKADCPVTEALCSRVLSLPIHPYMSREDVLNVVDELDRHVKEP